MPAGAAGSPIRIPASRPSRSTSGYSWLFVVILLRQTLELLEKDDVLVRRNLEALAAALARDVGIDAHEVVLHFGEHGTGALVGAARQLRFTRTPQPADRVLVRAAAARTLKAAGSLLRLLGEELAFIHVSW